MQEHIDDMMAGEHIILIFPTLFRAQEAFKYHVPSHTEVHYSERMWKDTRSGGWIRFGYAEMDRDKLQGILADIRFVDDAAYIASNQFFILARERSSRYAERKSKPLHK